MRAALLFVCAASVALSAQTAKTFKARLSPVPIDLTLQATIAGGGSVTATLNGTTLTINGTFDGLKSPATTAKLRKSPVRGVRGPEIFSLTASPATNGTITGTVDLSSPQVNDLQAGRLYVQLQSEKAPDGNLWGWLLPSEKR
jgi:hypothetical protein